MNYFFGNISSRDREEDAGPLGIHVFRNRWLAFHATRIAALKNSKTPFFYNAKSGIFCAIVGYVTHLALIKRELNTNYEEDVAVIGELYRSKGAHFAEKLDGSFTVFIFDENLRKGFIFQDRFGSHLPVYYIQTVEGFSFSTSLKGLLKNIKFPRELDYEAAIAFLSDGFAVPGEATLLRHVKKLVPGKYISIDATDLTFSVLKIKELEKQRSLSGSKQDLIPSIQDNIKTLFCSLTQKVPFLAVSSGYDSNFILHTLRKLSSVKMGSVTVGGNQENEIPQVLKILSSYQKIDGITEVIPPDIIHAFPDIVWRLEGYVFERGVFLQYVLAKMLFKEKGISAVFLGEGADQILDQHRHRASKQFMRKLRLFALTSFIGDLYFLILKKRVNPHSKIKRIRVLFEQRADLSSKETHDKELDFILKKNGVMLNSFGVQGLYAYLNLRTQAASEALGGLNYKKKFFRKSVKRLVAPRVARVLAHKKIGGSTDPEYLLAEDLISAIRIIQSPFILKFLDKEKIHKICANPLNYCELVLQLTCLFLFDAIFVSGKFDSKFDDENFEMRLSDFSKAAG
jgi:asparagine synthase (glutamine-hydrolysing)